MKLLLDTCVWGGATAELQATGHDVQWTGNLVQDPGDEDILAHASARQQGAVCQQVLTRYGEELMQGAIITVEAGRVRIRPPG